MGEHAGREIDKLIPEIHAMLLGQGNMISEQGKSIAVLTKEVVGITKDVALLTQNQQNIVMPGISQLEKKVIIGNGKPALCTTVALLEEKVATLEGNPKKTTATLVMIAAIVSSVAACVSIAVAIFTQQH